MVNNLALLKNIASTCTPACIASDIKRSPSNRILPDTCLALADFTPMRRELEYQKETNENEKKKNIKTQYVNSLHTSIFSLQLIFQSRHLIHIFPHMP